MSEVLTYREIALEKLRRYFLWLLLMFSESAYWIFSYLKKTEKDTGRKSMAYFNVRKRVIKLKNMGLIEEIPEKHRYRNSIKYRLTSHGLFHCLMMARTLYYVFPIHLRQYKDNVILQNILYRYFAVESLLYFSTITRTLFLGDYLATCCTLILQKVESFRMSKIKDKDKDKDKDKQNYMTAENI